MSGDISEDKKSLRDASADIFFENVSQDTYTPFFPLTCPCGKTEGEQKVGHTRR